jgi:hypothetical protein
VSTPGPGATYLPTKTEVESDLLARKVRSRPFLYLVIEGERPLSGGARFSLEDLDEVLAGRVASGSDRQIIRGVVDRKRRLTIRTSGTYHSKDHAIFRRTAVGWAVEDLGSRNGSAVNGVPTEGTTQLGPGDIISLGRLFFVFDFDETDEAGDFDAADISIEPAGFLTLLPAFGQKVSRLRDEASRATSSTLIGETGTGKEILAKAIHEASGRRGPYLGVNCGAIPKDLIQSELFGSVKGAYSGAENRSGYVRDAHQGTLLLDEIMAAPEQVQVALLRVLQERAVTSVGGTRPQPVDVRFIAAAQKPLVEGVKAGQFREDLRQRIEAFRFELPPLRQRLEDIGIFVASTLRKIGVTEKDGATLMPKAALRLLRCDWPGNIRELAQAIDVSWGGAKNGEISGADLPEPATEEPAIGTRIKQEIVGHLRATRGNVSEAANRMGRSRFFMYEQRRRHGLDPKSFRSS